jgi:SsrA-binding protein
MKILNRKANYEYTINKDYTAGIKLLGSEVKSLRSGECNINDAFVYIKDNTVVIKNMYVSKNDNSSYLNHEERRERTLLLNKKEINDIIKYLQTPGITIIPLEIFTSKNLFKVKRESLKLNDLKRELNRDESIKFK